MARKLVECNPYCSIGFKRDLGAIARVKKSFMHYICKYYALSFINICLCDTPEPNKDPTNHCLVGCCSTAN